MMNLCSLCVVLSLFSCPLAGFAAAADHGVIATVCGVVAGAGIGVVATFGIVWLERVSTPIKGKKVLVPFALSSLLSLVAPVAASGVTFLTVLKVSRMIAHS